MAKALTEIRSIARSHTRMAINVLVGIKRSNDLWASWNPRQKPDSIDDFLRTRQPPGSIVTRANWRDNPWFPHVLKTSDG
jgi:hypothetical protein